VDKPIEFVKVLHDLGVTVGVTLNPKTPVQTIEAVAPLCEMVLVMTVQPGFGGQSVKLLARMCGSRLTGELMRQRLRLCEITVRIPLWPETRFLGKQIGKKPLANCGLL
jgi:pentose-5-phosphate-3-epimerase